MNKTLTLIYFLLFVGALSCEEDKPNNKHHGKTISNNKKPPQDVSRKALFERFIKKFKPLTLPLAIKTLDIQSTTGYRPIAGKDSIFINSGYPNETWAYGMLPDTSGNIQLVWLAPAEIYDPVLTTFTKGGLKISEQHLGVGGCGSDCCFTCDEYIYIKKDRSIYSVDSIKSCTCDESGPKKSTMKKYIRWKAGKIGEDGKISLSGVQEKKLK
ncbi:hypothetical protein Q4E93_29355 [Flavitalea sp. BT771]|uniref:hypothetical protein n=1 Tax=Flavitalea sp. BT771 TaxID=3063329 RepID=UPI0026E2CF2E|nr:hypothetical protein [Flavitalea sp. BT771]MDO6434755.1 hypothetical protein [Flavitalea sp. BT771]MDV6223655.1 hypothetical protein [Flavitalea sp. BT771]